MRSLGKMEYMNNLAFTRYLLENLEDRLGYTLDGEMLEIKSYSDGYQVSVKDMHIIPFKGLTPKILLENYLLPMVKENTDRRDIGLWLDDGKVYIDFSMNIKDKKQALDVGEYYKQMSIYGWAEDDFFDVPQQTTP